MTSRDIHSRFSATADESIDRHPLPDHGNRCKTNDGIIGMPIHQCSMTMTWGRYSTSACITLWAILSEFEISINHIIEWRMLKIYLDQKILDELNQVSLRNRNDSQIFIFIFDEGVNSTNIFYPCSVSTHENEISCFRLLFKKKYFYFYWPHTKKLYFLKSN